MKKQTFTLHEIETALIDYAISAESATIDDLRNMSCDEYLSDFYHEFHATPCDADGATFAQLEIMDEITKKYATKIQTLIN